MHAAQGEALELAPQGSGHGLAETCLANARRTHEAEDGSVRLGIELVHAQKFQNAVLDLVQAVVVLVEDGLGILYVQIVLGDLVPGQFAQKFQIGADDIGLGGISVHEGEAAQLLVGLLLHFLGQMGLFQGFLEALQLLGRVFLQIAQLVAYGLELLAQVEVLLGLVHAFLGRGLYTHLYRGHFHLVLQLLGHKAQALHGIAHLEQMLGLLGAHAQVGGHKVGKAPRFLHALQHLHELGRGQAADGQDLFALLPGKAQEGFNCCAVGHIRLVDVVHLGGEIALSLAEAAHPGTGHALHQGLDAIVGHLQDAQNLHDRTSGIEIVGAGIVLGLVLLGQGQDKVRPVHGCLDGGHGSVPADEEGQDHEVEKHHVPQGDNGQFSWQILEEIRRCRLPLLSELLAPAGLGLAGLCGSCGPGCPLVGALVGARGGEPAHAQVALHRGCVSRLCGLFALCVRGCPGGSGCLSRRACFACPVCRAGSWGLGVLGLSGRVGRHGSSGSLVGSLCIVFVLVCRLGREILFFVRHRRYLDFSPVVKDALRPGGRDCPCPCARAHARVGKSLVVWDVIRGTGVCFSAKISRNCHMARGRPALWKKGPGQVRPVKKT